MAIRKYYLLMLLGMAANMFVVNDVRAMLKNNEHPQQNNQDNIKTFIDENYNFGLVNYIGFFLQWKNTFNLLGGALFTLANSHFNFYEYKESFYFDWWCGGWNSGRFANGYLQFCPNINFARGLIEIIMSIVQLIMINPCAEKINDQVYYIEQDEIKEEDKEKTKEEIGAIVDRSFNVFWEYTPVILVNSEPEDDNKGVNVCLFTMALQDFLSIPLIIHFTSNFSISIAFDSIIWMVVTHFVNNGQFEETIKNANNTINKIMAS